MSLAEIGVTSGGIAAIALLAWLFFGPKKARQAEVKGNVQEIRITVKGGYSPEVIRVKEGEPLRMVFDRQEASDCSDRVVFPDFQASKSLAPFARLSQNPSLRALAHAYRASILRRTDTKKLECEGHGCNRRRYSAIFSPSTVPSFVETRANVTPRTEKG